MIATRVDLSSGDHFYLEASFADVVSDVKRALSSHGFVALNSRFVNPQQIAQLVDVTDIPSLAPVDKIPEVENDAIGE